MIFDKIKSEIEKIASKGQAYDLDLLGQKKLQIINQPISKKFELRINNQKIFELNNFKVFFIPRTLGRVVN